MTEESPTNRDRTPMRRRLAASMRRALVAGCTEAAHWGVTVTDSNGNILAANEAAAELLGYERDELENLNLVDLCTCAPERKRVRPPQDMLGLTERQLEILQLIADGKSTSEVAAELFISRTTVRNHIAHLLATLDVHTRMEAIIVASRAGLVRVN